MYCFYYHHGDFYVIREFKDSNDIEIADIIPFYDVEKIDHWCKCANLKFPYEINKLLQTIFKKFNNCFDEISEIKYLELFDQNVKVHNIELFCEVY